MGAILVLGAVVLLLIAAIVIIVLIYKKKLTDCQEGYEDTEMFSGTQFGEGGTPGFRIIRGHPDYERIYDEHRHNHHSSSDEHDEHDYQHHEYKKFLHGDGDESDEREAFYNVYSDGKPQGYFTERDIHMTHPPMFVKDTRDNYVIDPASLKYQPPNNVADVNNPGFGMGEGLFGSARAGTTFI